ncbi:MAG: hypothetical protein ACP5XB_13950 [Isosphaeraceae bacterium]
MDSEANLRRIVGEVSRALTSYAETKGWAKNDFWIYYKINTDWDVILFIFVSRGIGEAEEDVYYHEIWQYLIEYYKADTGILRFVNLVVSSKSKVNKGGLSSISPSFEEYDANWTVQPMVRPGAKTASGL